MVHDIDEAFTCFQRFKRDFHQYEGQDLNETATRMKILDVIFIEILGWSRTSIEVEVDVGETEADNKHKLLFADYVVESNYNNYVIEAKRKGRYFSIPSGNRRRYSSSGVIQKSNSEYIDQAKKYMMKIGTPFCVLTNGYQFIIIRRPSATQVRDILVFRSLDDIENNFDIFWGIFNPEADGQGKIDAILKVPDEVRQTSAFNKSLYSNISNTDKFPIPKNISMLTLEEHWNRYFGDLTDDKNIDLLEYCYCDPTGEYQNFAGTIKKRLEASSITAIKTLTVQDEFKTKGNFEQQYLENLQKTPGQVYVLLGEVGAGKSTFIQHFYYFDLQPQDREKILWIRINFLDFNDPISHLNAFIDKEIDKVLQSTRYKHLMLEEWDIIKNIYEREERTFISGMPPFMRAKSDIVEEKLWDHLNDIKRNTDLRLLRTFEYIRDKLGMSVCFAFDNIDQKDFDEQKEVLLIAHQRSANYSSTVITAMRHQSYNQIKNKPPFDALVVYTYRIQPPRVKELFIKRLEALNSYPSHYFIYELAATSEMASKTVKIPLAKFVKILSNTLDKDRESVVERFFENLSGGNMRRILEFFTAMIMSGHTQLYQIVDVIEYIANMENTSIPFDEVLDAIAKENNKFYNSQDSKIFNLFKIHDDGFYSHFTIVRILKYLEEQLNSHPDEANAFVEVDDVLDTFSSNFVDKDRLHAVLYPMLDGFLINSNIGARNTFVGTTAVKISEVGRYYINVLLRDWKYIRNVLVDTSITNPAFFHELQKKFKELMGVLNSNAKMRIQYECVEIFTRYLEAMESEDSKFYIKSPYTSLMADLIRDIHASFVRDKKE
jgi:ABC-type dipeptide/oligopeptide/nickel transport system ATPase component